ncbi:hypothetical protein MKX03_017411, partial [Papaver bracteatum]
MIKLKAVLEQIKSTEQMSNNISGTEQRCFLEGNDLVLVNILSRLPVNTLMKLKLVCRRWRYLIKDS